MPQKETSIPTIQAFRCKNVSFREGNLLPSTSIHTLETPRPPTWNSVSHARFVKVQSARVHSENQWVKLRIDRSFHQEWKHESNCEWVRFIEECDMRTAQKFTSQIILTILNRNSIATCCVKGQWGVPTRPYIVISHRGTLVGVHPTIPWLWQSDIMFYLPLSPAPWFSSFNATQPVGFARHAPS